MHALLSRIVQARLHAIIVAAVSLVFPPFGFVCGGIVGLATLRHGPAEGILVASVAMLLANMVAWFVFDTTVPVIVFALMTGLPVLLLATVLRMTQSLATTVTTAGLLGVTAIAGLHMAIHDPLAWWRDQLHGMLAGQSLDGASAMGTEIAGNTEALVDALTPMMAALPAGAVLGVILTLFLARWWHGMLDNPGGFGREFRDLRFDRRLATAAIVVAGIVILTGGMIGIGGEFLQIFIVLYLFQGLAVAHGITALRGISARWLVTLYVLLFLLPGVVTNLLVVTGLADTWLDFRRRAMLRT